MRYIHVPFWSLSLAILAGCDGFHEPTGLRPDLSPTLSHSATATFHAFFSNLEGEALENEFEAAAGGAQSAIVVDFDELASGTDITGQTFSGITFQRGTLQASSAPLVVVRGEDTYTTDGFTRTTYPSSNKLLPTTGVNVLSPGGVELAPGPNPLLENDDLEIVFNEPVSAVGFDLLLQSQDCCTFADVAVYDLQGQELYNSRKLYAYGIPSGGSGAGGPEGHVFVGLVSSSKNIARVVINDRDGDNVYPDANFGYDSFRLIVDADVTPPEITVAENPIGLWAPNHDMHTISVADFVTGASDDQDSSVGVDDVVITSISSDEPDNGLGDGDTANDMVIAAGCRSMELRAERAGGGNGRVYTVHLAVADASGNVGTASFKIHVPPVVNRDAVDDGPVHSVAGCTL